VFVESTECGSTDVYGQFISIDSYEQKDKSVIVTAYIAGYSANKGAPAGEYNKITIYSNYYDTNASKVEEIKTFDEFKIEDSNKDKFTKYNFVFEKDSTGNYYFKSASKA
jgi:hypothetical protein